MVNLADSLSELLAKLKRHTEDAAEFNVAARLELGESADRTRLIREHTNDVVLHAEKTVDDANKMLDEHDAGKEARDRDALQRVASARIRAANTDKVLERVERLLSQNQSARANSGYSNPHAYQ